MSSVLSNDLLHLRLIEKLRSSHDPLSVVKSLSNNGTQLKNLNECAEIGTLLCGIVRRSYGLGMKILLDCGLDLSIEDPSTGDTPLLLVCSEGLCGSTRMLIHSLPRRALLHSNHSGGTALRHLLTRAHADCGCLEALLNRLHPCEQILPPHSGTNPDTEVQVEEDTCNMGHTTATDKITDPNTIFLTVEGLLKRIRSTDPGRIFSVMQLWIKYNLFLIQDPSPGSTKQKHRNMQSLCNRLVEPLIREATRTGDAEDNEFPSKLIHLITRLAILGQINVTSGWIDLEQFVTLMSDEDSIDLGFKKAAQYVSNPMSLQAITILRLRQMFQRRFIQMCHESHDSACEVSDALVFFHWIRALPVPAFMHSHILLDETDFYFYH